MKRNDRLGAAWIAAIAFLFAALASCDVAISGVSGKLPEKTASKASPARNKYEPTLKNGKSRYVISVIASGDYKDYYIYLQALFDGFAALDWMPAVDILSMEGLTLKERLERVEFEIEGAYVSFPPELSYDFDWDEARLEDPEWLSIRDAKGVDAFYSLGTFATLAFSGLDDASFKVPVFGESISDPVGSGVIPSVDDSGKDFLTVRYDPEQFANQIRIFHDVIGFKRLGVPHHDSEDGQLEVAWPDIERVAKEKGFEIVSYSKGIQRLDEIDEEEKPAARKAVVAAIDALATEVDAFYFGLMEGLDDENMPFALEALERAKKPSFSMEGEYHVKKGILLGTSEGDLVAVGLFNARKMIDAFRGAVPRSQVQYYRVSPTIVVNLKEAELIGYDVPMEIVSSADRVFYRVMGRD
jgi:ABC-type uncharacterized transport system substrate-binding protein